MNGLFLCGYGCKAWIWEKVKKDFSQTLIDEKISFLKMICEGEKLDFNEIKNKYLTEKEIKSIIARSLEFKFFNLSNRTIRLSIFSGIFVLISLNAKNSLSNIISNVLFYVIHLLTT